MKLRTQLILLLLLLTVLPMAGIVIYSYLSSLRAFDEAERTAANRVTDQMSERLDAVRLKLRSELTGLELGAQPGSIDPGAPPPHLGRLVDRVRQALLEAEIEPNKAVGDLIMLSTDEIDETLRGELERMVEAPAPEAPEAPAESPDPIPPEDAPRPGGLAEQIWAGLRLAQTLRNSTTPEGFEIPSADEFRQTGDDLRILFGDNFRIPIRRSGELVGFAQPRIDTRLVLERFLTEFRGDGDDLPFAVDRDGNLFAASPEDQATLEDLIAPTGANAEADIPAQQPDGWIIVQRPHGAGELALGMARPIGDSLDVLRGNAAKNLGYGLMLIGIALLGILPLSQRMVRSIVDLHAGAERFAKGDLEARVPVRSTNELGRLARTFNRMALELREKQDRLIQEERLRKDQELQQRLLAAENDRKSQELEEARQFQLSLLPETLPEVPGLSCAVFMQTATEVGGDYYDFYDVDGGGLIVALGDATGHGLRAGTLVTAVKALFTAGAAQETLTEFLVQSSAVVRRMRLGGLEQGRLAMALALARFEGSQLTVANAGMPPLFIHRRATGAVEELLVPGMPLGGVAGFPYGQRVVDLEPGDTVLLMSDGFPELLGASGVVLGYDKARSTFQSVAHEAPEEIIRTLRQTATNWTAGATPDDDVTFLVFRHDGPAGG